MPLCSQPGAPRCGTSTQQCDDGTAFNLDGCNAECGYEVVQRISKLDISTSPAPPFCVHGGNQFGGAIASIIGFVNQPLQKDIDQGKLNILLDFHCLTDLSGGDASGFDVGGLGGLPDPANPWQPSMPQDGSLLADASAVSAGIEKYRLSPASITSHALLAGPSSIQLNLVLQGSPALLTFDDASISATVSATSSLPGPPPASLDPSLLVFDSLTADGPKQGLCGAITIASLAQVPVPGQLTAGVSQCYEGYTACPGNVVGPSCNSMLDVLVGGCSIGLAPPLSTVVVKKTQPDVPGSGSQVTPLVADPSNRKVSVPQGDTDSYSSYFTFRSQRAHISGQSCSDSADCQSGQMCVSNICNPR